MRDNYGSYAEASRGRQQYTDMPLESGYTPSLPATTGGLANAYSIMGSDAGYSIGNGSAYTDALQMMQGVYGNQALQRYLSTQGTSSAGTGVEAGGYSLPQGAQASIGSVASIQGFPNNPTPMIPTPVPELTSDWWGQGPMTWGGETRGALDHERGTLPISGGPVDIRAGFGGVKYGSWQREHGAVHGIEGEGGLFDAKLGSKEGGWLNGGIGTFGGGLTWDRGVNEGIEGSLLNLSGGYEGHELLDAHVGSMEERAGVWDDGGWRTGLKANASLFDAELFNDVPYMLGIEVEGPSIGGEYSVGNSGFTIGGGANLIGGAMTVGDFNPDSNTDYSARFGLGIGDNIGARLHWGDEDGDKQREYGFGFDAGIFSMDIKSEDPLRSLIPFSQAFGFQDPLLPEGNMTNAALKTGWSAGTAMGEAARQIDPSSLLATATDAGSSMWDAATGMADSLW